MVVMSFMGQGFSQMMMKMIAMSRISSGQTLSCFISRARESCQSSWSYARARESSLS
jgi:hypothetical protein